MVNLGDEGENEAVIDLEFVFVGNGSIGTRSFGVWVWKDHLEAVR